MNKPQITTFVMSTLIEISSADVILNLGAKHFFKKPVNILNLVAIIEV